MWNFAIKGFLTLIFLCSIAYSEKILDPEEVYSPINGSIYFRLMNSPATKYEKDTVMGSLKTILAHIPDPPNWTSFTEVIREGKLVENIKKLGGEKSKNAVDFLQYVLEKSKNKAALTGFLDACLEFLSLESVSKTEKMLIMADFLTPSEYSTWYKGSKKLADVMGVRKVFVFPQNQIDYLVKYWNDTHILNESTLTDKLEKLSNILHGRGLFMIHFVQLLQNFEDTGFRKRKVLNEFKNWAEIDSLILFNGVDKVFDDLLDPRLLDFNFTLIETIENNLMEHPDLENSLMSQLGNEQVKNYFNRIDKKNRADALLNYTSLFIPMVKSYTKSELDAVSKFLKEYTSFKNFTKVSFGKILSSNATRYECWDMWKSQVVSSEMETMVKLVKLFDKEFIIGTCLWMVFDIRDIAQLSEYWNGNYLLKKGVLTSMIPVNQTFKETLQFILTETKAPSRSSYRRILKAARKFDNDNREFSDYVYNASRFHLEGEPLWMAMKQFFEYSEDQQKNYIDVHFADSNSSLGKFFKTIVPTFVDDFDVTFLKTREQWTYEQLYSIYKITFHSYAVKRFDLENEENKHTLEMVERVLDENVSYKDCKDSWEFKKDDWFAKNMRKRIEKLDENFGKMSCEPKPPLVSPGKVDLPVSSSKGPSSN